MFASIGKMLITFGVLLILIGLILLVFSRSGLLGKLPGDIQVQKKSFEFHFPIVTCILVSILLSAFFLWFKK